MPACVAAAIALPLGAFRPTTTVRSSPCGEHLVPDGSPDVDSLGVTGTYYLEPVTTDGLPLGEAAFLGRSSFVSAAAARSESATRR